MSKVLGEPYAGNLHVRFDEGEGLNNPSLLCACVIFYAISVGSLRSPTEAVAKILARIAISNGDKKIRERFLGLICGFGIFCEI